MTTRNIIRSGALLGSLSAAAMAGPALAHHAAGPGNSSTSSPVNTISAGVLDQGDAVAGIVIEQSDFDELSDDTLAEAAEEAAASGEPHAHFHSLSGIRTSAFTFSYGVTDNLTLTARLPYVSREDIREGHAHEETPGVYHGETHHAGDSEGWGDLSLVGQWRFLNDEASRTQMATLFGVEAPTGETDVRDAGGDAFAGEFQPGSDSWDYFLGFAASHGSGRWGFDASALYTLAGDGLHANLGDRLNYGVAASYRALGTPAHNDSGEAPHAHGPSLDVVFEITGERHDKQKEGSETEADSGGHVLYAAPGLRYTANALSAFASVGVPVITDFNGLQAEPDLRTMIGAGLRF